MYGVTIPDISAGSNQVGASDTCTPQVICPAGPALLAALGIMIISASARTAQIFACVRRPQLAAYLAWKMADGHVGAIPTGEVGMAFPLRSQRAPSNCLNPIAEARAPCATDSFCFFYCFLLLLVQLLPKAGAGPLPRCHQGSGY